MNLADYPLVSILIANYNNGRFISETLESAVGQTYPNTELVIIDDGSLDDSLQVIDRFMTTHSDTKIKLFKNIDNKGCGRIKRQCVELSEGDYFCFLDPEDAILPEAVATLMEAYENHPEYGIVYSTHYLCNEKLEPQSISTYPGRIPQGQSHLTSTEGHVSAFALCNRSIYDRTEGIDPELYVAEDQDLYLKMEEVAPVLFVNQSLYYYRHHDGNTSWNDQRRELNLRFRHRAVTAAYHRRRYNHIAPNLTRLQYHSECLNVHLQLHNIDWKQKKYAASIIQLLCAVPYSYTLFFNANR